MTRIIELSDSQVKAILSIAPTGTTIVRVEYFDNYSLPCPIKVDVQLPDGSTNSVVVRIARHGSVEIEARLLAVLTQLDFPAPRVLKGPSTDPGTKQSFTVLSLLSGSNLQSLAEASTEGINLAKRLLIEGITRLTGVTDELSRQPIAATLPHLDLLTQFETCHDPQGPWSNVPPFVLAVERLAPVLQAIGEPLVFTNGDYQPANFLAEGGELSGVVDFESAAFQDPLIGFAKYPIYDLHPLNGAGVVDDFLGVGGYNRQDFAPRLALGCLMTLQREISVEGGDEHEHQYRERVMMLLDHALDQVQVRKGALRDTLTRVGVTP